VKFSFELPTHRHEQPEEFATIDAITSLTRAAVDAGFSAVNLSDHPAPDTRWLDHGGHHALDPFVALAVAATADPDVRLFTNVYVAAYRNPFLGAKLVQSLEVVAGSRLILGVAAGYLKPEFAALGIDFDTRGALLDDALAVLDAVLAGGDVTHEGPGYRARGVRLLPRTPAGRRPPVWVGGNSKAAIRRAVRFEGWAPFFTGGIGRATRTADIDTVADLRAAVAYVRSCRADPAAPFDISCGDPFLGDPARSADEKLARLHELAAAGVTWVPVSLPGENRAELAANAAAFGREVIAAF
jgi:probable F420-dependent oxidoreductase